MRRASVPVIWREKRKIPAFFFFVEVDRLTDTLIEGAFHAMQGGVPLRLFEDAASLFL